ncbi:hypothetical protein BDA96_08G180300 [Sorghum bicolor]|uniref:Uncharacterized protein n=1 Tax=Sorghum bicolor TaxID=4558 RepID=A0A921U8G5_SORBI|nr:hypothetical protein BDA96_08G180300 [Sorghum bicolor]
MGCGDRRSLLRLSRGRHGGRHGMCQGLLRAARDIAVATHPRTAAAGPATPMAWRRCDAIDLHGPWIVLSHR